MYVCNGNLHFRLMIYDGVHTLQIIVKQVKIYRKRHLRRKNVDVIKLSGYMRKSLNVVGICI